MIWNRSVLALLGAIAVLVVLLAVAFARDEGQWENSNPAVTHWFQTLMMPDNPEISCCGEADAYWADEVHVRSGKIFAVITDTRDDAPLRRPHVDVGTEIEIPDRKLKWDRGNPTGHAVLFMNVNHVPFCFVMGTGI